MPDKLGDCDPIVKVADLWDYQKISVKDRQAPGFDPKTFDPKNYIGDEEPAIPCGLVAKSVFNDTF